MYRVQVRAVIDGTPEEAWAAQADVATWPSWNTHELAARIKGPFAPGTRAWSKPRGGPATDWVITEAEAPTRWSSRSRLPGGALTGTRTFTAVDGERVECTMSMQATGPLQILFRAWFGPRIKRDMLTTIGELESEIARRRPTL